jgi:glucose/arabinose dehydrogenase
MPVMERFIFPAMLSRYPFKTIPRTAPGGLSVLAVLISLGIGPGIRPAHAGLPAQFGFNTIATGFTQPMSFAYAPDGRIFVAERAGIVKIVKANGAVSTFLDMRGQINSAWGRGILSIVLDPQFASNKRFYMLYHEELSPGDPDQGGSARWRLVRLTPRADNPDAADPATLTTLATDLETTGFKNDPHSGGDLDFDPDGNLLATFGDGATPSALDPEATKTYDYDRLNGKMIRINPMTGAGIPANPFYDAGNPASNRSKVLARGLRQPFRFTVDRATGAIYEGDVGWDTWEELNVIATAWTNPVRDANHGWPCYEGESNLAGQQPQYFGDGRTSGTCNTVAGEGTKPAVHAYQHAGQGAAIIMGQAYRGTAYPGTYLGKVFWADFNRDQLFTYTPGGGVTQFGATGGFGSMVDFEAAPNGNLAYLSYNEGRIREIAYLGTNHAPVANATTAFVAGTTYTFNFSSAGSTDAMAMSWLTPGVSGTTPPPPGPRPRIPTPAGPGRRNSK